MQALTGLLDTCFAVIGPSDLNEVKGNYEDAFGHLEELYMPALPLAMQISP